MAHTHDWGSAPLGRICEIKGGRRLPRGDKFAEQKTPYPYIRITDFRNYGVDTGVKYLRPDTQRAIAKYIITKQDIYISIAGTIGVVGMVPEQLDGANLTENAARIVVSAKDAVLPRFLMFFLASDAAQEYLSSQTVRNAQPKLALARIRSISVPLPPIAEQSEIVRVLSAVQRAIDRQDRLAAVTAELKRAFMKKLFTEGTRGEPPKHTEIGPVPPSWAESRLGTIAHFSSGGTPSREVREYWVGGTIPWVKTTEIDYCTVLATEEKITQAGLDSSSAKVFPAGTLLIAMYGQGVTRGRVAILGIDAASNQACAAISPRCEVRISTTFLYYFLEFHYENLRRRGHGANQMNLSMALLKEFPVYYPDRNRQEVIVGALRALDAKSDIHLREQTTLISLFRALLHQLMTGQVRVQDLDLSALQEPAVQAPG